jgi:tetratricopeptide (TPR) repeat protein
MKHILFAIIALGSLHATAIFDRAQVAHAYAKNNMVKAQVKNDKLLTDSPQDPIVLYNAGKIASKRSQFEVAQAYFEQARQYAVEADNKQLQEQAQFDQGTALAMQKKYQEALGAYQEVLNLNPDNKYAQENKEAIEQLLKQQEEEKLKEKDKEKENKCDNNAAQQEKQQSGKDQEPEKESDQQQEQQQEHNKDNKKHTTSDPQSGSQGNDSEDNPQQQKEQESQQSSDKENKAQNTSDGIKRDAEEQLQKEADKRRDAQPQQAQDGQQPDDTKKEHSPALSQSAQLKEEKNKPVGHASQSGAQESEVPLDERQKRLLSLVEQADEQVGKNLVQRAIAERMRGSSGGKNW